MSCVDCHGVWCGVRLPAEIAVTVFAAEMFLAMTSVAIAPVPASAQFFDDRFPFQSRQHFDWSARHPERSAPDYSKAPLPKASDPKDEIAAAIPIMVLGDAMADWLAYGLELAYTDSPDIVVLRRHRANSGLIRSDPRNDRRGEYPDWPQAAREMISAQKPKFVLMMLGLNDRKEIQQAAMQAPSSRAAKQVAQSADSEALEPETPTPDTMTTAASEPPMSRSSRTLEFRTKTWSEAYIRRIDETIASLKTSGVPVFWVGLPPLRGPKSAVDIPFLNDLYRSRADKAGIIYVDVGNGFVDEDGRYAPSGPDVEGQTRRLRTSDGAFFTQAGARKLAHYVEREVERWMKVQSAPVAIAIPNEPKLATSAYGGQDAKSRPRARPLFGPIVPLLAERASESEELLGDESRQPAADALVTKVLVRGEAISAPAGRADDFAWPGRGIAPVGSDPVVATTDLPMTPMVAPNSGTATAVLPEGASAIAHAAKTASPRRTSRPHYANAQWMYRPSYQRPSPYFQSFGYQYLFGPRWLP
jgi:hypothetical protein